MYKDSHGLPEDNKKWQIKNKKLWIVSIVGAIVLIVAIALVSFFLNNNIFGSWTKVGSENSYVLTINKNGTITVSMNAMSVDGTYNLKKDNIINFDIKVNNKNIMTGEYTYKVNFNFIDKKLELTDEKGNKEQYVSYKKKETKGVKDFALVEQLVGKWRNDETGVEYEFDNNGIAKIRKDNMVIDFNYKADDNKITFMSKESEEQTELYYKIDNNVLKLGGVDYIKQ